MTIKKSTLYKIRGKNTWDKINNSKSFSSNSIWIKSFFDDSHSNEPVKLGFAISKKYGNAVKRNRFKRRVREIVRKHYVDETIKSGTVLLVGVTKNCEKEITFKQASDAFSAFIIRLK